MIRTLLGLAVYAMIGLPIRAILYVAGVPIQNSGAAITLNHESQGRTIMPEEKRERRCETCAAWESDVDSNISDVLGSCHARSPDCGSGHAFPETHAEGWCLVDYTPLDYINGLPDREELLKRILHNEETIDRQWERLGEVINHLENIGHEVPISVLRKRRKKTDEPASTQTAEERGMEMMSIPMSELPTLAIAFLRRLEAEAGTSRYIFLTAWTGYAQCVEGLSCTHEAYMARPIDIEWFKERMSTEEKEPKP